MTEQNTTRDNIPDMPGNNTTESPSYAWKFCSDDYPSFNDLPDPTYENPEQHYYYDVEYECYCYDWCPSYMANLPVYPAENLAWVLYMYVAPVILAGGLIGNLLILAMFFTKQLSNMPSKPFFQALALTDNVALVSGLMVSFVRGGYHVKIMKDAAACKLKQFSTYTSTCASAWLVAALTIDRFVSVNWPMKAHVIRYRHRAYAVVAIFALISLFYSHFLISESYDVNDDYCYTSLYDEIYSHFYLTYWTWLDLTVNFILPFCLIVFCNVGMVFNMRKSEGSAITSTKSEDTQASRKLTRLFIVISTAFVVTVMPINIELVRQTYNSKYYSDAETYRTSSITILVLSVCRLSYYSNNAINFLLYCIGGRKFREALVSLVWCGKT